MIQTDAQSGTQSGTPGEMQADKLTIALAQLNPTVGDISGNGARVRELYGELRDSGGGDSGGDGTDGAIDLILFSELFICGYPPEDLVLKPALQQAAMREIESLAALTGDGGPAMLIGTPWLEDGQLYNAMAFLREGELAQLIFKRDLPNYSVFDEKRVFAKGPPPRPISLNGIKLGVPICEDIWSNGDICAHLQEQGAQILLVPNGSPFSLEKQSQRLELIKARVRETGLPLVYVNQIGGQDELVFDGASFVCNHDRSIPLGAPNFSEALIVSSWRRDGDGWSCQPGDKSRWLEGDAAIYQALVLGLRDYVRKNGFPGVVLGLSGGIDSALCAAIAVDALGPSRVHCLMLPYHYTSAESLTDARACAELLGVRYDVVDIEAPVKGFNDALAPLFEGREADTTEENIQSRTRGVILMAVSNKLGDMLVTTGNKSEMSVGYATIYGDMNGGFNPVKDIYKMQVFALSRWRNAHYPKGALGPSGAVMPENIIDKPPSAELRPDQTDQDSLPEYPVLDDILQCLVERELPLAQIVARGHDESLVRRIEHLLSIAEYKRRQAAPGVKISSRNFGRDRRYPITNRFRDKGDGGEG